MIEIKVASGAASARRSSRSASDMSVRPASCELWWLRSRAGTIGVTCTNHRGIGEDISRQASGRPHRAGIERLKMATLLGHEGHRLVEHPVTSSLLKSSDLVPTRALLTLRTVAASLRAASGIVMCIL